MSTYKDSGVDVEAGDDASGRAYKNALATFASRKGMIGAPASKEAGFGGLIDMGDFYLVQTADGTGSKMGLALDVGKLDTLGSDLLAMVTDDAICTGAEVIALSNTFDVPNVDPVQLDQLTKGLSDACITQKIAITGGEIAEVPSAVKEPVWNATCIGIVKKDRLIKADSIKPGDTVLALRSAVARSNGFSLIRHILKEKFGDTWTKTEWKDGVTWGEIMLTPSIIYHAAILSLIGRFDEKRTVDVKGIAHITGGGIPSKFRRILKASNVGAKLTNLFPPHPALQDLITLGNVQAEEAYRTWNMGNGMLIVVAEADVDRSIELLGKQGIEARTAGSITKDTAISLETYTQETLTFKAS